MNFFGRHSKHTWRSLINSFKPLPLPVIFVRGKEVERPKFFESPNVRYIRSGCVSAEGNTCLFAGRVTTEEGMKRSLEMAEQYVF